MDEKARTFGRWRGRLDHDDQPRFEMAPMLDVVFLLLIFFLFQLQQSVDVRALPVNFATISGQGGAAQPETITWIFIDKQGNYQFNKEPVSFEKLKMSLLRFAGEWGQKKKPVYLAVDSSNQTNQNLWPKAVKVIDLAHQLNIHLVIVGAGEK